jgi:hypothetical protein
MSRPKPRTNQIAKPRSPLHVIGAGFLATRAGGTTVTVASVDHSVIMQGNAPTDALVSPTTTGEGLTALDTGNGTATSRTLTKKPSPRVSGSPRLPLADG